MTRKEELEQRARGIVMNASLYTIQDVDRLYLNVMKELQQVEREVWAKCADKIELLMEKENESTDDQIWEFRDWCKQQQEGL